MKGEPGGEQVLDDLTSCIHWRGVRLCGWCRRPPADQLVCDAVPCGLHVPTTKISAAVSVISFTSFVAVCASGCEQQSHEWDDITALAEGGEHEG